MLERVGWIFSFQSSTQHWIGGEGGIYAVVSIIFAPDCRLKRLHDNIFNPGLSSTQGWNFNPGVELGPGLKILPCNSAFDFDRVSYYRQGWNFNPVNTAEFNPGVENAPCNRSFRNEMIENVGTVLTAGRAHNFPGATVLFLYRWHGSMSEQWAPYILKRELESKKWRHPRPQAQARAALTVALAISFPEPAILKKEREALG
jgi:hypothetical protein